MNQHRDEGDLESLNRLLERLHQAGYAQHGSHIEIVWVSPGAQHVNHQYVLGETARSLNPIPERSENASVQGCERIANAHIQGGRIANPTELREGSERSEGSERTSKSLPEVLATEEAMVLWQKVKRAGYVDEDYQPLLSRTQAALLADAMAERLGIREKWKVFEGLWNRKNMYRDYYKALNLQQSLAFQDEIKKLLR
jgi:hypothetical protein